MSNDLVSRSALIDELKQSGMIVDNDYGNAMVDFISNHPTAYDVDKVIQQINSIGKSYCDSVNCDKNCEDCEHGCIMRAITEKVKAGGTNE